MTAINGLLPDLKEADAAFESGSLDGPNALNGILTSLENLQSELDTLPVPDDLAIDVANVKAATDGMIRYVKDFQTSLASNNGTLLQQSAQELGTNLLPFGQALIEIFKSAGVPLDATDSAGAAQTDEPQSASAATPDAASTPPAPTCSELDGVEVRYQARTQADVGGLGYDEYPYVTVVNHSPVPVVVTFAGSGTVTAPPLATPLEMSWGADDGPLTVSPGQTKSESLGLQFGEVLLVAPGAKVLTFEVTATLSTADGSLSDCPGRATRI